MSEQNDIERDYSVGAGSLTRRELLGAAGLAATGLVLPANAYARLARSGPAVAGATSGGRLQLALTDTEASETLDPATAAVSTQFVLVGALYNTLIRINSTDWSLRPELAESWEANSNFTKYQIKLRPGVVFHNGKPVKAADVVWSILRHLDKKVGSAAYVRAKMSLAADSAKAVNDSTIAIHLTRSDSQLPYLLGRPFLAIIPAGQTRFTVATANGTGPFKLDHWQAATSWSVSKNPHYWESGLPYLDGIDMVVNAESAARLQGTVTGQFHLAEEIEYSSARAAEKNSAVKVIAFPKGISRVIVLDCSKKPFSDLRVRRAFKYAMNRSLADNAVYAGFAVSTSDIPIPPTDPYYPHGLGVRPYDPDLAKSLLKQAGYGGGLTETLLTSTVVSGMVDLAATFAKSAAAAGIHVNIQEWAPATYWDQVWTVKPFYTTYWETLYPPDGLWYVYAPTAAYNEAKLKLPQVTSAYNTIMKTGNHQKQVQTTQDIYHLLANEWGHIIPSDTKSPWVSSPKLQGVVGDQPYFRVLLTRASLSK